MKIRRAMKLAAAWATVFGGFAAYAETAAGVLDRTRAMYAALQSYSDSGVVINEYGASSQDRNTFTTYFNRAPRHFLLDAHKQGGDRYTIWADPIAFHTWWKTTGQQYDYPNPNNAGAITLSGANTKDAALKIPTLLYGKALGAAFLNITGETLEGTELLSGRNCYRIKGTTGDVYAASGKQVNIHTLTVWIDTESLLIRKAVEEWKPLPGQRSRNITTFEPQANPALKDDVFARR